MKPEILTPKQMAACDAHTIAHGTPGTVLMESAGRAVANETAAMLNTGDRVLVLAGPGNNGGDGYVAARLLADKGFAIEVASLGDPSALSGDALWACQSWSGSVRDATLLTSDDLSAFDGIVDALFGAGLSRPLDGAASQLVDAVNRAGTRVLSVDLPSGLDGETGLAGGPSMRAERCVTFHRLKPGHLLYPGRAMCGSTTVVDIGMAEDSVRNVGYLARLTGHYLCPQGHTAADSHKYAKGHVVVLAGEGNKAGAGFLAAQATLRAGAGLVTLGAPTTTQCASTGLYPALMRTTIDEPRHLAYVLDNPRINVCAIGPGLVPNEKTRQLVYNALASPACVVLDAGALTAFECMQRQVFDFINEREAPVVITPHDGEFRRLFPGSDRTISKIERTQRAAADAGAIVVLKGPDTVIAHPQIDPSTTFVNGNAPPWLATAGTGDVLTGIIAAQVAQVWRGSHSPQSSQEITQAVAYAVWLHGEAAKHAGPGLVASDLDAALRDVLRARQQSEFPNLEADERQAR